MSGSEGVPVHQPNVTCAQTGASKDRTANAGSGEMRSGEHGYMKSF